MYDEALKRDVYEKAVSLGARIVRTCSVECWEREPMQEPEYWPQNIWPWAKRVIALAIPLLAPMAASAPSMVYQEQYNTSNRIMDNMSYSLAAYIMADKHYRAVFFPRDCYANLDVLLKNPNAAFSHVIAGYYAGVGTIGDSHNLITKEFGPRVRLVSVITDAPIEPDEKLPENLCIHCKKCLRDCPAGCFTEKEGGGCYEMDRLKCTEYHKTLSRDHRSPCGFCATFCPVGEDMKLYRGMPLISPEGKAHIQRHGS